MNYHTTSPHLSTIKETAKALQVSVRTVNSMWAAGAIPSVKVGRFRRFHLARVLAHLGVDEGTSSAT